MPTATGKQPPAAALSGVTLAHEQSYHEDAKIAEKVGPETILLHPADAAHLALLAGDLVSVWNATGRLTMRAEIGDIVPRGVALAHKSRWPKLLAGGLNVNALNPARRPTWPRAAPSTGSR